MTTPTNDVPRLVSRAEWLEARKSLLEKEKALTRARDALNAERRQLPMVLVDEPYLFEGPHGKLSLLDLFEGRDQPRGLAAAWGIGLRGLGVAAPPTPE